MKRFAIAVCLVLAGCDDWKAHDFGPMPEEMLEQCRKRPETDCVLITGKLAYPGEKGVPDDACVRYDPKTGQQIKSWKPMTYSKRFDNGAVHDVQGCQNEPKA